MAEQIESIRLARKTELANHPALVVSVDGEIDSFDLSQARETDSFVVAFGGVDKDEIRRTLEPVVTAVLNAITLGIPGISSTKKVADSVVFKRDDGMPIYSFTEKFGTASVTVLRPLPSSVQKTVESFYDLLISEKELQRVQRLLRAVNETHNDRLRSFINAWNALEILISKVFAAYEEIIFTGIFGSPASQPVERFTARIREVMRDKYRITDKFAAVTSAIGDSDADKDFVSLMSAKKMRDRLLHGEPVDEITLPVEVVTELATKYLRAHLLGRNL